MNVAKKSLYSTASIYFIGNSIITLLQFIMMRFITEQIPADSYGYYNLIVAIDNIITPILTIQMGDAIFRFFYDSDEHEKKKVFTAGIFVLCAGTGLIIIGSIFINIVIFKIEFVGYVVFYIVSTNIYTVYQKIARSMNCNTDYVIVNIIRAVVYLILQIVLLYIFHMKMASLFLATSISSIVCIIILEIRIHSFKYFSIQELCFKKLKEMINYSLPLVPNTLLWWLSSSVNAIIVSVIIGLNSNGIYSVSNKFASILTVFTSVFLLAWQESVIKEYGKENTFAFYNDTFHMICRGTFSAIAVLIPFTKVVMPYMIAQSYYDAVVYAPVILISTGFSVISGYFGSMFGATKKTKGAMTTTIYAVVVNLVTILLLIKIVGLWAAAIAGVLSSIALVIIRYRIFQKEMHLEFKKDDLIVLVTFLVCSALVFYLGSYVINIVFFLIAVCVFLVINRKLLFELWNLLAIKLHRGNA